MSTTIWHNPRCSKSRQTLALVEARDATVTVRRYLDDAPTADELREVLGLLGIEPRELMRKNEDAYRKLRLSEVTDRDALIEAMAQHPRLIERPVVIVGDRARLGRPPEDVLELFE